MNRFATFCVWDWTCLLFMIWQHLWRELLILQVCDISANEM